MESDYKEKALGRKGDCQRSAGTWKSIDIVKTSGIEGEIDNG